MDVARKRTSLWLAVALVLVGPAAAGAGDHEAAVRSLVAERVRPWLREPLLLDALRFQNARHAVLEAAEVERLDLQWRLEARNHGGPLIDSLLSRPLSAFLRAKQDASDGLFTEIFVIDGRGLNAGQSAITSDYMQGDEAKWRKTFLVGPDAVFVDDVDYDDSTGILQCQVSLSVADPANGRAIGVVTVGVDVGKLK